MQQHKEKWNEKLQKPRDFLLYKSLIDKIAKNKKVSDKINSNCIRND